MKVLVLALSPHGYGETLIGLSLADQLREHGITSTFLVEPSGQGLVRRSGHRYEVLQPGMGALAELIVDDVVAAERPDVIVLSDYWVHVGVLTRRYGIDPWFVERYGVPVLPVDIWEWEKTDFRIDLARHHAYPVDDHFLDLPAALRPVPIAHSRPDGSGRARPFRFWTADDRVSRRTRGHLWTTLGLGREDRLVMMATAAWQHGSDASYRTAVGPVQRVMPRLLAHYLRGLPDTVHFLFVGEQPDAFAELPPERVHVMPSCAPSRFGVLLGAADLVLSLNVAASTVGRAVLSGVPALVLENRFAAATDEDVARVDAALGGLTDAARQALLDSRPLHPFRMWPLGFHAFLDPVLTDNPYADALVRVEILDEPAVRSALEGVLFDPGVRARLAGAQHAYLAEIESIPPTVEVFDDVAGALGVKVGGRP